MVKAISYIPRKNIWVMAILLLQKKYIYVNGPNELSLKILYLAFQYQKKKILFY